MACLDVPTDETYTFEVDCLLVSGFTCSVYRQDRRCDSRVAPTSANHPVSEGFQRGQTCSGGCPADGLPHLIRTSLFPHAPLLHERTRSTRPSRLNSTGVRALKSSKCDEQSEWTGIGTETSATHGHPAVDAQELWGGDTSCDPALLTASFGLCVSGSASTRQWCRQHDFQPSAQESRGGSPLCDLAPQSTSFGSTWQ